MYKLPVERVYLASSVAFLVCRISFPPEASGYLEGVPCRRATPGTIAALLVRDGSKYIVHHKPRKFFITGLISVTTTLSIDILINSSQSS